MEDIYVIETLNPHINNIYPLDMSYNKSEQKQCSKFAQLRVIGRGVVSSPETTLKLKQTIA